MKFVDTAKLTQAFRLLRKEGMVAKQRFSCCNSCASYEIAVKFGAATQTKREKDMKGCVFYHIQNAETLKMAAICTFLTDKLPITSQVF